MLDVHAQLAILSKGYQANGLIVFDISKHLNRTLRELEKLKSKPGTSEQAFWDEVAKNQNADALGTCQLFDGEEGRKLFKEDREAILDGLAEHLTTRFKAVLDNPILNAMGIVAGDTALVWRSATAKILKHSNRNMYADLPNTLQ